MDYCYLRKIYLLLLRDRENLFIAVTHLYIVALDRIGSGGDLAYSAMHLHAGNAAMHPRCISTLHLLKRAK